MALSVAALGLAAAAIAGAYATSNRSTPVRSPAGAPGPIPVFAEADNAPPLQGAFATEAGPEGAGQWIGDVATISTSGFKRSWIAFRALSLRSPRTLEFVSSSGVRRTVTVGTDQQIYTVGPFPEGVVSLIPRPRAAVASAGDRRRVSVFISSLRTYPMPLAALPGAGFWPVERVPGVSFNWLGGKGAIDIDAPASHATDAWLTFVGRSLGENRTLTMTSGQITRTVKVSTTAQAIEIGPFPLVGGRGRVVLQASPGARRYPGDPRMLSVQLALLAAQSSPTGG